MTCPHCGNPMAHHAAMCSRCRQATNCYTPSPEEIARLAHEIRWGDVPIVNESTRRPRKKPQGPRGGTRPMNDDEERLWRRSQLQPEESEVEE